jgi:hypothetical protein
LTFILIVSAESRNFKDLQHISGEKARALQQEKSMKEGGRKTFRKLQPTVSKFHALESFFFFPFHF